MRHMLNPLDFSVEEIDRLLTLASDIVLNNRRYENYYMVDRGVYRG